MSEVEQNLVDAARAAATSFFAAPADLTLVARGMTAVFRATVADSKRSYLLRLHDRKLHSSEDSWYELGAIRSELMWLDDLVSRGLPVPSPIETLSGAALIEVRVGQRARPVPCTVLEWIPGDVLDDAPSETQARELGRLCARLHRSSERFSPPLDFTRPVYDALRARRSVTRLSPLMENGILSAEVEQRLLDALGRVEREVMDGAATSGNWGMIHADIHPGNVLADVDLNAGTESISLIDFGRCGFGAFQYDIAEALQYLSSKGRRAFLAGYESCRSVGSDVYRCLEAYLLVAVLDQFATHANDPDEEAYLTEAMPHFLSTCVDPFLADRPFLFG